MKQTIHGSCVAFENRGVLIIGQSGSGKSSLALQLIMLGATLVSDDLTLLEKKCNKVFARCPDPKLCNVIEARGVGLLYTSPHNHVKCDSHKAPTSQIHLVIDLDQKEQNRYPPQRQTDLLGEKVSLIFGSDNTHFPAAIVCLINYGYHHE